MKIREKETLLNFEPNEHQIHLLEQLTKNEEAHRLSLRQAVGLSERWFKVNMDPLVKWQAVDHEERGPYHITAVGRALLMMKRGYEVTKEDVEGQRRKDFLRVWKEVQRVHKKALWLGTPAIEFDSKGKPFFREVKIPERHTLPSGRHVDLKALWVMAYRTKDGEPHMIVRIPTLEEMREEGLDV